jgi:hypothetical protein
VVLDPIALRNANLDVLYGNNTPHAVIHLRLPLHTCFEDELHDCHIVTADESTLESIAKTYGMTGQQVCQSNPEVFGTKTYCDPTIAPLPKPHVGMELLVNRLYPTPPSPCKEESGYWSCYAVTEGDIIWCIASKMRVDPPYLMQINFGKNPVRCPGKVGAGCETSCPVTSADCLKIGQVLTVPVAITCENKDGAWSCIAVDDNFVYNSYSSQCSAQGNHVLLLWRENVSSSQPLVLVRIL